MEDHAADSIEMNGGGEDAGAEHAESELNPVNHDQDESDSDELAFEDRFEEKVDPVESDPRHREIFSRIDQEVEDKLREDGFPPEQFGIG